MQNKIFENENVEVSVGREFPVFLVKWINQPTPGEFKENLEEILKLYIQYGGYWMYNTDSLPKFDSTIEIWLQEKWLPRLLATGIEFMSIIIPYNRYIKLKDTTPISPYPSSNLSTAYFYDERDAYNWLRQISLSAISA